jgi:hypothetical protein
MRKSREVPLTLLAGVALASITGCEHRPVEVRNCVDSQNHIVPDKDCQNNLAPTGGGGGGYHYVYGGASGEHNGDTVVGGEATPEAGAEVITSEEAVSRGGFGRGGGEGGGDGSGHGAGGGGE